MLHDLLAPGPGAPRKEQMRLKSFDGHLDAQGVHAHVELEVNLCVLPPLECLLCLYYALVRNEFVQGSDCFVLDDQLITPAQVLNLHSALPIRVQASKAAHQLLFPLNFCLSVCQVLVPPLVKEEVKDSVTRVEKRNFIVEPNACHWVARDQVPLLKSSFLSLLLVHQEHLLELPNSAKLSLVPTRHSNDLFKTKLLVT